MTKFSKSQRGEPGLRAHIHQIEPARVGILADERPFWEVIKIKYVPLCFFVNEYLSNLNEFYFVQLTAVNKENCESFISKSENSRSLDLSPKLNPGFSTPPTHAVN